MLAQIRTHIARGPIISMISECKDIMTGPRTPEKKVNKLKDPTPPKSSKQRWGGGRDKMIVHVNTYVRNCDLIEATSYTDRVVKSHIHGIVRRRLEVVNQFDIDIRYVAVNGGFLFNGLRFRARSVSLSTRLTKKTPKINGRIA